MNSIKRTRIEEFKIKAAILLKQIRSTDVVKSEKAVKRFLILPFLKDSNAQQTLKDIQFLKLKCALQVIALENGCETWSLLRGKVVREDCLFHNASPSILNVWFNNYDEAKQYQTENGGYLIQYRKDFAVCPKEYIDSIGLGRMEQEWENTGYDWVKPADKYSWEKLFDQAKKNYLTGKALIAPFDKSKRPSWAASSL